MFNRLFNRRRRNEVTHRKTLRDEFAMVALQGLLSADGADINLPYLLNGEKHHVKKYASNMAELSYLIAAAMIDEKEIVEDLIDD